MARAALLPAFAGLSGSLGSLTIVQLPDGALVRARQFRRHKPSPAQAERARSLARVGTAWRALDDETYAAWRAYAESKAWRNPATGAIVRPKPFPLFTALALKVRQIDPQFDLAGFMPPERPFTGDAAIVLAQASGSPSFRSGERKGLGDGEQCAGDPIESSGEAVTTPSPTVPPCARGGRHARIDALTPQLQGEPSLSFSADRANAPGVVTELLAQPLANARRAVYRDKYVSKGFVAFAGPDTAEVPLAPGAWAVAYRFVLAATGQETEIVPLGMVAVSL